MWDSHTKMGGPNVAPRWLAAGWGGGGDISDMLARALTLGGAAAPAPPRAWTATPAPATPAPAAECALAVDTV